MRRIVQAGALTMLVVGMGGCTAMVVNQLKTVSAGHTGCAPDDNVITNIKAGADGGGTWNATCNGKVYLCSGVGSGHAESFSCAAAVN